MLNVTTNANYISGCFGPPIFQVLKVLGSILEGLNVVGLNLRDPSSPNMSLLLPRTGLNGTLIKTTLLLGGSTRYNSSTALNSTNQVPFDSYTSGHDGEIVQIKITNILALKIAFALSGYLQFNPSNAQYYKYESDTLSLWCALIVMHARAGVEADERY
ncbi:hypothetical protein K439DRAFT_1610252 [Ramaria rubella]|nr:hypothetical protein K439DRAFT_1610252 [Ramaria rubella]